MADPTSKWSIGIYYGPTPFELLPHPAVNNPVISRHDVSDVTAQFVADPFIVRSGEAWHMFFEVLNSEANKGEIGLASSPDGLRWSYEQIVIAEPFHMSYPFVLKSGGDYYMLPETEAAGRVQLYRATRFPHEWSPSATLLEIQAADATIFFTKEKWWMLACTTPYRQDTLCLYTADLLTGPWSEHPSSPIVKGDPRIARPAGRAVVLADRVIRYAQDCSAQYGSMVRAFNITELSPTAYAESESESSPVLKAGSSQWNSRRMHHIDPHPLPEGGWIACVDGDGLQDASPT